MNPSFPTLSITIQSCSLTFGPNGVGHAKPTGRSMNGVSEEFPDVVFGKIDTEAEPMLAKSFNVRSIPTTVAFKDGIGVFMQPGALPEDALRDLVAKLTELDMDEVRAEMETQKAAQEEKE